MFDNIFYNFGVDSGFCTSNKICRQSEDWQHYLRSKKVDTFYCILSYLDYMCVALNMAITQ